MKHLLVIFIFSCLFYACGPTKQIATESYNNHIFPTDTTLENATIELVNGTTMVGESVWIRPDSTLIVTNKMTPSRLPPYGVGNKEIQFSDVQAIYLRRTKGTLAGLTVGLIISTPMIIGSKRLANRVDINENLSSSVLILPAAILAILSPIPPIAAMMDMTQEEIIHIYRRSFWD